MTSSSVSAQGSSSGAVTETASSAAISNSNDMPLLPSSIENSQVGECFSYRARVILGIFVARLMARERFPLRRLWSQSLACPVVTVSERVLRAERLLSFMC